MLFVGRIQPLKAPDVLIRAVARLVEREPRRREHLRLIVIGSASGPGRGLVGHPRAARRRSSGVGRPRRVPAARGAFRAVPLLLRVRRGRRPLLQRVVRPGRARGAGLRASRSWPPTSGGLRHAVHDGHTGRLVAGHDTDDWADALAELLDHPAERARLGANAAAHASRFSWSTTAAATLEAYGDALRAARRRAFMTGAWFERGALAPDPRLRPPPRGRRAVFLARRPGRPRPARRSPLGASAATGAGSRDDRRCRPR